MPFPSVAVIRIVKASQALIKMNNQNPGKRDISISKSLSYLLRHGAEKEKLSIDPQGWVELGEVLRHNRLKSLKTTPDDISRVVAENEKQRFRLKTDAGTSYICANQGHTLKNVVPELVLLDETSMPTEVFHGTYQKKLEPIKATGLSRMSRNHIHLTSNAPWSKLGIRASCDTLIYIDTDKCMKDGFKFWRSTNGVILCEGNADGVIPPHYFKSITEMGSLYREAIKK